MSSLETYPLKNLPGNALPFVHVIVHVDRDKNFDHEPLVPGSIVTHISDGNSQGMVVAINDREVTVVWTVAPRLPSFSTFNMRMHPPATRPSSKIFYLDYKFDNKKEKEASDEAE